MTKPNDVAPDLSPRSDEQPIADALAQHHRGIEEAFDVIVARAEGGDPLALRRAWDTFEHELLRHLEIEETDLLPLYARSRPDDARALCDEHEALRETLFELGLGLDLHQLRADVVADFAARLRAHARREDRGLYPWLDRNLSREGWAALGDRLAARDARVALGASPS